MDSVLFIEPRLVGARFEDHTIPLEFLKDFAVLEEMIVEVAKAEYMKEHPERQRSPRGFAEGVQLKLAAVEEGSAKPVIVLAIAAATLFPLHNEQTYFERARDSVIGAIHAAEHGTSVTQHLPERVLGYFDRMGRSLRQDEAMEFSVPGSESPARLTKETRKKLVLASSKLNELTEETEVRGTIPEADQQNMTFQLQTPSGRRIPAPIAPEHMEAILEAFNGYCDRALVHIQGIGRFSRTERLLRFDTLEQVTMLDPLDVTARAEELRQLKPGWLDGGGATPPPEGLDWVVQLFAETYPEDLPLPYIYPTASGDVQAEWSVGDVEISLLLELETHAGRWHRVRIAEGTEDGRELNLDAESDRRWVADQVRSEWSL